MLSSAEEEHMFQGMTAVRKAKTEKSVAKDSLYFRDRAHHSPISKQEDYDPLLLGVLTQKQGEDMEICVFALAVDEKQMVAGTVDGIILTWKFETGFIESSVRAHERRISSISTFYPPCAAPHNVTGLPARREKIISCSHDSTIKIWDLETSRLLISIPAHDDWVNECRVSIDGRLAVSCSNDHTVKVWDLEDGKMLLKLLHDSFVYACSIFNNDPHDTKILTADRNGNMTMFNLKGELTHRYTFDEDYLFYQSCSFSYDGKFIVTGSFQGYIRVFDVETFQSKKEVKICKHYAEEPMFSSDGKLIVCYADTLQQTQILSANNLSCLQIIKASRPRFSANSSKVVCRNSNREIEIYWTLQDNRRKKLMVLLLARKFCPESCFFMERFPLDLFRVIVSMASLLIPSSW